MGAQTRGFLFSDLRGYTAYAETHGDHAVRELLTQYRRTVRNVIAQFGGAEIRTEGDSFYVVFESVSDAVRAGLAVQAALAAGHSGALGAGIGIHAGEVEDDAAEGIVSNAVNIAARICSTAGPGEVVVSELVQGLTRTYLDVVFVPLGRRRLKGIRDPVPVYRVRSRRDASPMAPRVRWYPAAGRRGLPVLAAATVLVASSAIAGAVLIREGLARDIASPTTSSLPLGTERTASLAAGSGLVSGSQLAVVREAGNGTEIVLIESPLDPGTRLTVDGSCFSPAWSPDGESLAFLCQSAPALTDTAGATNAYVIEVGTGLSDPVPITSLAPGPVVATDLAWTPDGTLVVATGPEPIASGGVCPPDACGLSFHDAGAAATETVGAVLEVSVSPATGEILYVGPDPRSGTDRLYSFTPASGEPIELDIGISEGVPSQLDWSPDGRAVVLTVEAAADANADLFVYDVDSRDLSSLVVHPGRDSDPSWSPDGKSILFASDRQGTPQIWAVDVDGVSEPVLLLRGSGKYLQADWRPAH